MLPERVSDITTCQDLIQCAYNLGEFEVLVYYTLVESGPMRADELAVIIGRDRSTVYRSLQKLMTCGMVYRETKSMEKGGYYHIYKAISKKDLKEKLEKCVNDWYSRMQDVLKKFLEEARTR